MSSARYASSMNSITVLLRRMKRFLEMLVQRNKTNATIPRQEYKDDSEEAVKQSSHEAKQRISIATSRKLRCSQKSLESFYLD